MTTRFETFSSLVETIGAEAMDSIRLNSAAYSLCTVAGSHTAFRQRCSVLLSEVDVADLLGLLAEVDCGHWKMPEAAGTLSSAVRIAVIDQIDEAFKDKRIDFNFEWADGQLFKTLELCAGAARKVVAVRRSREIEAAGESIVRFLTRVRHLRAVPDMEEFHKMLVERSVMFRPVVNDPHADWTALRHHGIDKPYLFELMTKLANYACLQKEDRKRFVETTRREANPVSTRETA